MPRTTAPGPDKFDQRLQDDEPEGHQCSRISDRGQAPVPQPFQPQEGVPRDQRLGGVSVAANQHADGEAIPERQG